MNNRERAVQVVEDFEAEANKMQSWTIENIVPFIEAALDEKSERLRTNRHCLGLRRK